MAKSIRVAQTRLALRALEKVLKKESQWFMWTSYQTFSRDERYLATADLLIVYNQLRLKARMPFGHSLDDRTPGFSKSILNNISCISNCALINSRNFRCGNHHCLWVKWEEDPVTAQTYPLQTMTESNFSVVRCCFLKSRVVTSQVTSLPVFSFITGFTNSTNVSNCKK